MKTKLYIGLLVSASLFTTGSIAQDLASAETKTEEVSPAASEEETPAPTFSLSGSIDTYARTTLGTQNGGGYGTPTSFANLKGFGLGMANVILSYSGEKAGFTADLVFGPRGKDAVFVEGDGFTGQRIINQMYAFYKVSDKVTFNMGQFNTFLGYEVISPAVNFHYSTSYLFSYGPFTHTGLRADFDFGNGLVGKLAVMNPTDILEFNPINTYTLGAQLGHSSDAGGIWLNVIYGDQDGSLDEKDGHLDEDGELISSAGSLFQVDLTTGWNLGEKFYLGFNGSMQSVATGEAFVGEGQVEDSEGDASSFFGVAIYPKVTLSESFSLGARAEYFSIKEFHLGAISLDTEGAGAVTAVTLSGNYKVGGLTLIPEVRIDSTTENTFTDADGDGSKSMTSLLLAAVYKF
jgi:hypothetical protein